MVNRIRKAITKHGFKGTLLILANKLISMLSHVYGSGIVAIRSHTAVQDMMLLKVQNRPMVVSLKDVGISRELLLHGIHEAASTQELLNILRPGMVIVEIGANIGYYCLVALNVMGRQGRIYAFEPSEENMRLLRTNVAINDLEGFITTIPKAVGNINGQQSFYIMSKRNMSSFLKREEDNIIKVVDTVSVETVRLDDYFKDIEKSIDFVRMDVEGYEFEVINGMKGILQSRNHPSGLFIEVHSHLLNGVGSSCRKFVETLIGYGYAVKVARYRGRSDITANSATTLLEHPLAEEGYWEVFFQSERS